jgi:hypothetical protein
MRYSSLGIMILKFIQDTGPTADNDRYSFIFKASLKLTFDISKVQYVVLAILARTSLRYQIFAIIDHEGKLRLIGIWLWAAFGQLLFYEL